jgi:hypothetical protein
MSKGKKQKTRPDPTLDGLTLDPRFIIKPEIS